MTPKQVRNLSLKSVLLERIKRYCRAADVSPSRVANLAVNDGDFVRRLDDGGTCTITTYEKFMSWLDEAEQALRNEVDS